MFAKLKQKIAEEETSSEGTDSASSSPRVRRVKATPKVNGWTENKWERRRLSNASLYESRESLLSERSYVSGYVSRRASFTSRSSPATPLTTPIDPPNSSIGCKASREEILAMLARKSEQVTKLEVKIADMASLLKENSRTKENLEEAIERLKRENSRKLQDIDDEYEQRMAKMKTDHERALNERNAELNIKLKALAAESNRYEDMSELHNLQEEELTKMKGMFIEYQTDATRKASEILEKSKQLENLDKEYASQKSELDSLQERLDDLARERTKYEVREKQLQNKISSIENENSSLRDELNRTVGELTQKSLQQSRVEKSLGQTESELSNVRQSYTLYKNKTSLELQEKESQIENLQERTGDLERRLQDCKLSGNDKYQALERDRQTLESRLTEAREQLSEARTSSNDRINTLSSLVSTLNERQERKETALTECKRLHDDDTNSLREKIKSLEERLSSTNQLISDTKSNETGRIKALIQRNEQLEQDLERARQNLNSSSKSADEQISNMEMEIHQLEETRSMEKSEVEHRMDQLKEIENEYSMKVDQYKQHIADVDEEKEQLQGELDTQFDELRQVSVCLEDAMKRTYELKNQIANLQDNLKKKDDMLTCFKDSKEQPKTIATKQTDSPQYSEMSNSDAIHALRDDLEHTRIRCKKSEEAILEREKTILKLRQEAKERDDDLNRSSTKLKQYEENNRFVKHDRIYASDARDSHRVISVLRQKVKDLEQLLKEREMLQLDENELRDLRKESLRQQKDAEEKEKKIKLLQSKLAELKKAFQRELKMPVPGEDSGGHISPGSPTSDTSSLVDKDKLEFLDMNFKYLKHVVLKYMCSDNKQSRQLINVISHLLRFSPKEQKCVREAVDWKLPLE